jgi:hypothetical protein
VERHVTLLGILTGLWGALALLIGVSMALIAAGALAHMLEPSGSNVGLAAGLTAGMFAVLGVIALLWGGVHVWTAALLRRRRPLGRVLALALGVVNLIVLPFGTALGIYALWVLLKNDGRRLFFDAAGPAGQFTPAAPLPR